MDASQQSKSGGGICAYTAGKPRTLVSSHSGSITLAISLQEPVVYLPANLSQGPSSYREHDAREALSTAARNDGDHGRDASHDSDDPLSSGGDEPTTTTTSSTTTTTDPTSSSSGQSNTSEHAPSILRGSLLLKLTKPTKLKSISLSFYGKCKTEWSQLPGNPYDDTLAPHPLAEVQDEVMINCHNWEFMPSDCRAAAGLASTTSNQRKSGGDGEVAVTSVCTDIYGADAVKFKNDDTVKTKSAKDSEVMHNAHTRVVTTSTDTHEEIPLFASALPSARNRRAFFANTSFFHKDSVQFPAGEYVYNFTLAIDPRVPETVSAPHGMLNYFLVPKVARAGAFALNLTAQHEVELVRMPPSNCEGISNNPIAISRDWDDRLHYEIMISRKYVNLGSSIPMAIRLTPLEKVRVHRVRVHVIEQVQYTFSQDSSVTYTERPMRLLLYEKKARPDPPPQPTSVESSKPATPAAALDEDSSSSSRDGSHGLLHFPLARSRTSESPRPAGRSKSADPKATKKREKLTGNLLHYMSNARLSTLNAATSAANGAANTASVEEAAATMIDCTLPLVSAPAHNGTGGTLFKQPHSMDTFVQNLHADTFNSPWIKVRHRLTISFRISKQDPQDVKRRHFEVKIDTPIHFLSKHCTTESVDLPDYNDLFGGEQGTTAQVTLYGSELVSHNALVESALPTFEQLMLHDSDDGSSDESSVPEPPPDYNTAIRRSQTFA